MFSIKHFQKSFRHSYLNQKVFDKLDDSCAKILARIVTMIDHGDQWVIRPRGEPSEDADPSIRRPDTSLLKLREFATRA